MNARRRGRPVRGPRRRDVTSDRKAIGEALGGAAGKGTRVVASYDEDTTSMGVEAARAALRGAVPLCIGLLGRPASE